jgi:hypothetical protein
VCFDRSGGYLDDLGTSSCSSADAFGTVSRSGTRRADLRTSSCSSEDAPHADDSDHSGGCSYAHARVSAAEGCIRSDCDSATDAFYVLRSAFVRIVGS